jgi:hypothetical protein
LVVRSERMAVFWVARLTVVAMVIVMLREAAVPEPLLWIDPTTGSGAAWALGPKAWLGPRWFELAGAFVLREWGCGCPALIRSWRHVRTHSTLLSSVVWNQITVFWVARLIGVAAPMTGGGPAWILRRTKMVQARLRLIGFCSVVSALGGTSGLQPPPERLG